MISFVVHGGQPVQLVAVLEFTDGVNGEVTWFDIVTEMAMDEIEALADVARCDRCAGASVHVTDEGKHLIDEQFRLGVHRHVSLSLERDNPTVW